MSAVTWLVKTFAKFVGVIIVGVLVALASTFVLDGLGITQDATGELIEVLTRLGDILTRIEDLLERLLNNLDE